MAEAGIPAIPAMRLHTMQLVTLVRSPIFPELRVTAADREDDAVVALIER